MARYEAPQNDNARLALLSRAVITHEQEISMGKRYISTETIQAANTLIPVYEENINAKSIYLGKRSERIKAKNDSLILLECYVRDFWEVAKRQISRLNMPPQLYHYYHLNLNGKVPKPTARREWLAIAAKLIDGDTRVAAQGYSTMSNPSAKDLEAILTKAKNEASKVAMADRNYDIAQEKIEKLRPQAKQIITDIMAELRFNLRKKDKASRRRIMRSYGVRFKYQSSEAATSDIPEETEV